MSPAVQAGREIRDFIDQKRLDLGLSGEDMLGLLLAVTYGFAESEVFRDLKANPDRFLTHVARFWQKLHSTQRIQVVENLRVGRDGMLE